MSRLIIGCNIRPGMTPGGMRPTNASGRHRKQDECDKLRAGVRLLRDTLQVACPKPDPRVETALKLTDELE